MKSKSVASYKGEVESKNRWKKNQIENLKMKNLISHKNRVESQQKTWFKQEKDYLNLKTR